MPRLLRALVGVAVVACGQCSTAWAAGAHVEGVVRIATGAPLFDATVEVVGSGLVTRTDVEGRYRIVNLRAGTTVTVAASSNGFLTQEARVALQEGVNVADFALQLSRLSETVTVAVEMPALNTSGQVSGLTLSPEQVAVLPSLGEKDLFRALQLLPGIASRETSSGLFVRGGTPSQNLVSYDGFTVYHVDHLFGYFTAFNMDAVEHVHVAKGAFEAKDGGRLGAVLDITGKTGGRERPGFSAGVSLLSAHGLVETPLGGKASLLVAGRRSFQGPLYDSILALVGNDAPTAGPAAGRGGGRFASFETQPKSYFYDGNVKLLVEPSSRDRISLSSFLGRDLVDNSRSLQLPPFIRDRLSAAGREVPNNLDIRDERVWRNLGLSARWRRDWGGGVESRLTAAWSAFDDENERATGAGATGSGNTERNQIDDLTTRFDLHVPLRWNHSVDLGAAFTDNHIRYAFETNQDTRAVGGFGNRPTVGAFLNRDDRASQFSAYLHERSTLFRRVTVSPGLRLTRYDGTEETYLEPRVTVSASITGKLVLKAALGVQHQFANRVTREDAASGNREFWALSDGAAVPVARARQSAAGFSYETHGFLVDVEAFDKRLTGLAQLVPQLGRVAGSTTDLSGAFHTGEGQARGLEVLLQKKFGRNTGWVSYTWSGVEHTFPTLQEAPFAGGHDQPHELKVVDTYRSGRWTFSGTWVLASGQPYTLPTGVESTEVANGFAFDRLVPGARNEARLPAYQRLDLAAHYDFLLGPAKARASVSLFNAAGRGNVWYKEFQIVEGEIIENDILLMGRTLNAFVTVTF